MTIDIFVVRGAGDKRGPDIQDPMLTELAVAMARGRVEIDRATPSRSVQISANFKPGRKTGQLIEVADALQGKVWRGKITSLDNAIEGTKLVSRLTVERVA